MPYHWIWFILWTAVHLAVAVRVLLNSDINSDARLSWLLAIVFLPAVGVVLYFLFGEPWVARRFRRLAARNLALLRPVAAAARKAEVPERFRPVFATCESITGCPAADGNLASLCADSDAAIEAMVADFRAAKETIHISFYIWLADNNGLKVVEALSQAAARGVVCRVAADAIGSRDLIRSTHWAAMRAAGVRLCASLRPKVGLRLWSITRPDLRNHRKIVIVDDRVTYCGSQNCADPQFRIKPKFAPWVDIMMRIEGPAARQNQIIFASDWSVETGEDLSSLLAAPPLPAAAGFPAVAFGTGPTSPKGSMSDAFVALLNSAVSEAVVTTPYFVPDRPLLAALLSCARRGVATTLVLPARNDSRIVAAISRAYYPQLLAAGIVVREFHGGLLHAKTLVVDGSTTLIGSANMDFRSLYLNFENNILLHSREMSAAVRERQDSYMKNSTPVSPDEMRARSRARAALDNLLTIVGPIF